MSAIAFDSIRFQQMMQLALQMFKVLRAYVWKDDKESISTTTFGLLVHNYQKPALKFSSSNDELKAFPIIND